MERGKTIGLVIFKKEGKAVKYLLLHRGGEYWTFPKGRPQGMENELETAFRELEEETGIVHPRLVEDFREEYNYDFDTQINEGHKEKVYQTGIFYLAEVYEDDVRISQEHIDYGWFDYDTAYKRLFYQNNQNILKKAQQMIFREQDFVL